MKNSCLMVFLALLLIGCTAKDTKTVGGNMMSSAGSGGLAAPIFFAAGGLVYAIGSSAEDDSKNVDANKSSYIPSRYEDNNDTVPYQMLQITVSDVDKNITKDK